MTARTTRLGALVVLTAIAAARWVVAAPAAPTFHAVPEVAVVELPSNGSGAGSIVLHNDTVDDVAVGRITVEPGCDPAVHASPLTGFSVPAGQTRPIAITCTPAPAGMQRCNYRVRSASDAVLLEVEAVCAYAGATTLVPDLPAIDFGTVAVGATASRTIALRNAAAVPFSQLFVESDDLAGNFRVAAPCNPDARECDAPVRVVPPGGTTAVVVTCAPRAAGLQSAALRIATGAGTRLPAPIALTCTGTPATTPVLAVAPGTVDVGTVEQIAATARTTVHLSNVGSGALDLLDIQIVDEGTGGAADWSYLAGPPCAPAIPATCTLAAGETTDLELAFDPSAIAARDATLLINYHDTADRSTSIPLRGVGHGATLEIVGGQTILDFGALPLDATAALTFQLANHGTRNLAGGAIAAMPAGAPFSVAPSSFAAATSAPTTITATCHPTTAGMFTADLQISASDAQRSPIDVALRCTGDAATVLTATPPALHLGEVRLATQLPRRTTIAAASGAPIGLATARLETPDPDLSVTGAPATTPAMIELVAAPQREGDLAARILVTPSSGPPLAVAVTGTAVAASYAVEDTVSLGTFCVEQPTTPAILALSSGGTATIALAAPALQSADSPFDLELVAPLAYPSPLAARDRALVAATPKRRSVAGLVSDDLVWTTDVAGATAAHTKLTATFVDNGGAIAPSALSFGPTPIHLDLRNAQQLTLQNCDVSALQLDRPQIPSPFTLDSPDLPRQLRPGETTTFSVGFHPTKLGVVAKTLVITSPQLRDDLAVTLTGEGIAAGGSGGTTGTGGDIGPTSFYACSGCSAPDPSAPIALAAAALCIVLRPRRYSQR